MNGLKLDVVAIRQDDDQIDPYVVCEGVTVDASNEYNRDGEGLQIPLRFLYLCDGRILIVQSMLEISPKIQVRLPGCSWTCTRGCKWWLDDDDASRPANSKKEADATFWSEAIYAQPNTATDTSFSC
ncbi:hypothetical protein PsorP6_010580 [Peronosclerospora sorghi]|uniref:Uncharacterized protein n=1 Tax=Peronosclerospora sorghi TaxID=230839 RepID=A0ACC0VUP1_9STRA|nr:hypothetical protein PsorP6_010580 [Peronosclerospora sorghi]